MISIFALSGCTADDADTIVEEIMDEVDEETVETIVEAAQKSEGLEVPEEMVSTIRDWILGTEYGIDEVEFSDNIFTVVMPEDKQSQLADFEKNDISDALKNIGKAYGFADSQVIFGDGSLIASNDKSANEDNETVTNEQLPADGDTINLIFIHHSVGRTGSMMD